MAIAGRKPLAEVPTQPNTPKVQPDNYKSIIYDDDNTPITSLIAYVEGAPWTVEYYQQVLSKDNDLREVDPGQPNVYQQYNKIKQFEIRVNSALSTNYDSNTGITGAPGNGIIYPFLIPNINDYFVTDAGDTAKAIFRITNVDRKTFNRDSAFGIEYELVNYVHQAEDIYQSLVDKTVREFTFSKDRLIENLQPILKDEDYQKVSSLKQTYAELVTYYFKTFFNRKFMTLVVPGQDNGIYDPYMVNVLIQIVNTNEVNEVRFVKRIPTDFDPFMRQPQFWDLMERRDYDGLTMCNQKMGLVSKYLFNKNAWLQGVFFSNIEYLVYPDTPDTSTLVSENPDYKLLATQELVEATNVNGSILDLITMTYPLNNSTIPLFHPVLKDDFYVLSQAFYEDSSDKSLLEVLVKDYLKMQALDLDKLYRLTEAYRKLGRLEQFYYGPILMILIKEADRASYT